MSRSPKHRLGVARSAQRTRGLRAERPPVPFGISLAAIVSLVLAAPIEAATWVVNTLDDVDDGSCNGAHCSLREAIAASNGNPGPDVIEFDPGLSGDIAVTGALTIIGAIEGGAGDATEIHGETALDSRAGPDIGIAATGTRAIVIDDAYECVVRGLRITGATEAIYLDDPQRCVIGGVALEHRNVLQFNETGIYVMNRGQDNRIKNCWILDNTSHGIVFDDGPFSNLIGGIGDNARNVISANGGDGIHLTNTNEPGSPQNDIIGNYIGIETDGFTARGNAGHGIFIGGLFDDGGYDNTLIRRNVISANGGDGIHVDDTTEDTLVERNLIGVNADTTVVMGNGDDGVDAVSTTSPLTVTIGPDNVIIGNVDDGVALSVGSIVDNQILQNGDHGVFFTDGITGGSILDNRISGNSAAGVRVTNTSVPVLIERNVIGLDSDGTGAEGNHGNGVVIDNSSQVDVIDCVISANGFNGILIQGSESFQNDVSRCRIGSDATGTLDLGNGSTVNQGGVRIQEGATGCTIGPDNIIGGHDAPGQFGVGFFDFGTEFHQVRDSRIGVDATGFAALPNHTGIRCGRGARFQSLGHGNLISGNIDAGIYARASNVTIQGNWIGSDSTGTGALPNRTGIHVASSDTQIGGSRSELVGNLISGNTEWGIETHGEVASAQTGTIIEGNDVGLDVNGDPLGNGEGGVWIGNGFRSSEIGDRYVGGDGLDRYNRVAYNEGPGVAVGESGAPVAPHTNEILTNLIHDNALEEITLDLFAPDYGNYDITPPTILGVSGGIVYGNTNLAGATSTIQIFAAFAPCEALVFVGETTVSGTDMWSVTPIVPIPTGSDLSGTNTGDIGGTFHTSELCIEISIGVGADPNPGSDPMAFPTTFALIAVDRNPFRLESAFTLAVPWEGDLETYVFDVNGRRVRDLSRRAVPAGLQTIHWDGRGTSGASVPAGVYFLDVRFGHMRETRRLIRIR